MKEETKLELMKLAVQLTQIAVDGKIYSGEMADISRQSKDKQVGYRQFVEQTYQHLVSLLTEDRPQVAE